MFPPKKTAVPAPHGATKHPKKYDESASKATSAALRKVKPKGPPQDPLEEPGVR